MPVSKPVMQPSSYVPLHALGFSDPQGNAVAASLSSPLPVAAAVASDVAATSSPLTGIVSDTSAHVPGPFVPQLGRDIWATLVGTGASGTAQLLRSIDGGATRSGLTAGGNVWASWSFSALTGPVVNEAVTTETSAAATYYLAVTLTAGSLAYTIAQ